MSESIWYFLVTGISCRPHSSALKLVKYMGIITRMQILYQIIQWKPHSCTDIELVNFDTKCKAWIWRSSSAQVTLPTEYRMHWDQWGMIDIQSEPREISIADQWTLSWNCN